MRRKKRQRGSHIQAAVTRQETSSDLSRRKRRFLRSLMLAVAIAVVVLVVVGWWVPRRAIRHAEQAIQHWRFEKATQCLLDYPNWGLDRGRVYYLLARVARQQDGYALAREHLRTAVAGGFDQPLIQRELDLLEVQNGGLEPELLQKLEADLKRFPEDGPAIYEAIALGFGGRGESKSSFVMLERWIQDYPNDGRPFYWKGFFARISGDEDSALAMYSEAAKRDPKLADAHLGKARMQTKHSRDDSAMEAYRDALVAAPERLDTRIAMAETLWAMRRPSEAAEILEPIARSNFSIYPAGRRVAQYQLLHNRPSEAIATLEPMMKLYPDDASLNYLLAEAYAKNFQADQSAKAMERFYIANASTDSLRYAREDVVRNRDAQRLFTIASTYRRFDWGKAKDWLEFATKVQPGNPELHRLRSAILMEGGSIDEATRERNIADTQSSPR